MLEEPKPKAVPGLGSDSEGSKHTESAVESRTAIGMSKMGNSTRFVTNGFDMEKLLEDQGKKKFPGQ